MDKETTEITVPGTGRCIAISKYLLPEQIEFATDPRWLIQKVVNNLGRDIRWLAEERGIQLVEKSMRLTVHARGGYVVFDLDAEVCCG